MTLFLRDDAFEIEVGRKAALAIWDENRRASLVPLEDILGARVIRGKREGKRWARKQTFVRRPDWVEHGIWCPCDGCEDAVKRLLKDVGVLP